MKLNGLFLAAQPVDTTASTISMVVMLVVLFALLYFVMIRPQQKKEKKLKNMRDSLQVGDEITSVGGVIGRVVSIKEDSIVVETGADRTKMRLKKWAIQSVDTVHE